MNNDLYNQFDVIIDGSILSGFNKKDVTNSIVNHFNITHEKAKKYTNNEPIRIKQSISHKQAFQYQQVLSSMGLNVTLKRVATKEIESSFSMVPEGEEQTSFKELEEKLAQGDKVICSHCNHSQKLAPICSECGRQLIGKIDHLEEEQQTKSNKIYFYLFIGAILLLILGGLGYYFLPKNLI